MLQLMLRAFTRTEILIRYMIGGGLGAITQFTTLYILHELLNTNATLSSAIGFSLAVIVNYTFQYHLTFKSDGAHRIQFSRFTLVALTGLAINTSIFWTFHELFGLYYLLAQVGATGIVFGFNYLMNFYYTFQHK
ncbi:MAG: GtrA family protein [Gammaproteobacteria bacterium]|nr:GtrA family protein [Gammaproteobacteria bacterium]